jgi:hypothetical protein
MFMYGPFHIRAVLKWDLWKLIVVMHIEFNGLKVGPVGSICPFCGI